MIDAGSIGIRAIWIDAEARQSADRFYADMRRKRDEAMSGGGGMGQGGGGGRPNPGDWRGVGGSQFGANSIWINPSGWRTGPIPSWMQPGAGGGGQGGGGGPPGVGGGAGGGIPPWMLGWRSQLPQPPPSQNQFPSWMMGMQSQINQQPQIPPWLMGWSSPINPGQGRGGGGYGRGIGSGIMNRLQGAGAVYAIAHLTNRLIELDQGQRHLNQTYELHGELAGAQEQLGQVESTSGLMSFIRRQAGSAGRGMGLNIQTTEERRETITRHIEDLKDRASAFATGSQNRTENLSLEKIRQETEKTGVRNDYRRRQMDIKDDAENLHAERRLHQADLEDQLDTETDPFEQKRIKRRLENFRARTPLFSLRVGEHAAAQTARLEADDSDSAKEKSAEAYIERNRREQREGLASTTEFALKRYRARRDLGPFESAAEVKRIDEAEKTEQKNVELRQLSLHNSTRVAQLIFQDKPLSAKAEEIARDAELKARDPRTAPTRKEAIEQMELGKLNLQNMIKETQRRSFAEEFDPQFAAFGVHETGKEGTPELIAHIAKLIDAIDKWVIRLP